VSPRPFRFMAGPGPILDRATLVERARRAEALGYDLMAIPDHLLKQMAPLPAMVSMAEATTRLRVGAFVLNNDLRHPAVLAQDLATIDQLTGGRLVIGIGAGWNQPEYAATGIQMDPPGVRIGRMEEAIAVLKGLFADGPFTFEGRHYRITEMEGWPKPVQRPHPPLIVGGGGRRVMRIAAREAQIVSLAPRLPSNTDPDIRGCLAKGTEEKIRWIREAAEGRFDDLELVTYPPLEPVTITDDPLPVVRSLADVLRQRFGIEVGEQELLDSPHVFVGTVDAMVEKCLELRERYCISTVMVLSRFEEFAPVVERLAGR
jgi:probable F420-dependent oxidoreductase